MPKRDIISKLKQSGLCGRSGSGFPVYLKWQQVKKAKADKKYVICNSAEGDPGTFKDKYILEEKPNEVINGIKLAMEAVKADSAYIYIKEEYYKEFKKVLEKLTLNLPIELFRKPCGYLCGEETVLLNIIEGKEPEPRIKPPFPTQAGLWARPTLINNLETFYWVSKIAKGEYQKNRFYCLSGEIPHLGVYQLPENHLIGDILRDTNNLPDCVFFVQAGGGASGEILLPADLQQPVKGIGSIIVFDKKKTNPIELMKQWVKFFLEQNCDKCTPCREGLFRIAEILERDKSIKQVKVKQALEDIFFVMEKTSFCPLGRIATTPFKTAIDKLL